MDVLKKFRSEGFNGASKFKWEKDRLATFVNWPFPASAPCSARKVSK